MDVPASITPGTPSTIPSIRSTGSAAVVDERLTQAAIASQRTVCVGAAQLHVLTCAYLAGEVAHRTAQEARPEVEPEHVRGLRDRLEEHRSVAGAARSSGRLAHEPGVDQRLQRQRDRRLRDAGPPRDLGPGDRSSGTDGLQHGALVEVLEQRRRGSGGLRSDFRHLVKEVNSATQVLVKLDSVSVTVVESSFGTFTRFQIVGAPAAALDEETGVDDNHPKGGEGMRRVGIGLLVALVLGAALIAATARSSATAGTSGAKADNITIWVGWSAAS